MMVFIYFGFLLLFLERLFFIQIFQSFGYILKILNNDEMFLFKIDLKYNIRNRIYRNVNNINNWGQIFFFFNVGKLVRKIILIVYSGEWVFRERGKGGLEIVKFIEKQQFCLMLFCLFLFIGRF